MNGWNAANWVALGGVVVALLGYLFHHHQARREWKMRAFADALGAVAEYQELPYRIRRRQGSDAATRAAIAERVSDVQVQVAFHLAWLEIESDTVAVAYRDVIAAARRETGGHMSAAWSEPPVADDAAMNLGIGYATPECDAARTTCLAKMRAHLGPLRGLLHR